MTSLEKCDPQVAAILAAEVKRQSETLELIASENHCSGPVMEAMGSVLTDKYAEGYPHRRYYCGNENTDAVEQLCIDRAKKLFGAEHANVQPHSGTSANLAVYMACIKPGDKIIGVPSTGVHSNGLSLARRVVEKYAGYDKKFKGKKTFGQELLTPTRIYHESLTVAASYTVHGMCHITGGGLLNFKRLSEYGFLFDTPLAPPGIFTWIQKSGDIAQEEMYRTFNMGMGYAYVVPKKSVTGVLGMVKGAQVVGTVTKEPGAFLGKLEIT